LTSGGVGITGVGSEPAAESVFGLDAQSRPEVEVESTRSATTEPAAGHGLVEPVPPTLAFPRTLVRVCVCVEPGVAVAVAPGVAVAVDDGVDVCVGVESGVDVLDGVCVAVELGVGEAIVVSTGEAMGDGAAVFVGAGGGVVVCTGVEVTAGAVAVGTVVVAAAGVVSGVLLGAASWAVASAPSVAA
jgi:hypothetical protein